MQYELNFSVSIAVNIYNLNEQEIKKMNLTNIVLVKLKKKISYTYIFFLNI